MPTKLTAAAQAPRRQSTAPAPVSLLRLAVLACATAGTPAMADTDISNRPLITNQVSVKPNLMFVLDNSGSMDFAYIPEAMGSASQYGFRSPQCNGAAYDPTTTYDLPVTPDGRNYPASAYGTAWWDGFLPSFVGDSTYSISDSVNSTVTGSGTQVTVTVNGWPFFGSAPFSVNDRVALQRNGNRAAWISATVASISGSGSTRSVKFTLTFSSLHEGSQNDWRVGKLRTYDLSSSGDTTPEAHYYYAYTGSQPAMSWSYNSDGSLNTDATFVKECRSSHGYAPGSDVFTKVTVSSMTTEQKQNYANWYSYHRKRILMMRTSAGRAIANLDSSYRVGFNALNNGTSFNTTATDTLGLFTNIRDFDDAQRVVFFSNLYGANIQGGTPLRRALAKAGQYYAKDITGQTDPIQHACQRNFTLLTTDGYWNDNTNPLRPSSMGGTAIGNQDGDISDTQYTPRPVYDGSGDSVKVERRETYTDLPGSSCGSSGGKTNYRILIEERTITSVTLPKQAITTSDWTVVSDTTSCGKLPKNQTTETVTGGGQENTLADVAAFYYKTDLRPTMLDSVFTSGDDAAKHQHMTTYTLGLGLNGILTYDPDYLSQTSGDYAAIKAGTMQWPAPPLTSADSPAKVDDLWHAAVNGRGRYFSAGDPQALTNSLTNAFSDIAARNGAGAAAASSTLQPVLGTDHIFLGSYRTRAWTGNLKAHAINTPDNGITFTIGPDEVWSAASRLDAMTYTSRNIYYQRRVTTATGVNSSLGAFTWANLNSDADASTFLNHFNRFCDQTTIPTQCPALTTTQKTSAKGENLVNFLRGERANEGTLYRTRESRLGDIVDASPVFVGAPPFKYTGQNYTTYQTAQANRCPVVYAAGNDGMLHAFSAKSTKSIHALCPDAGSEMWAYIPRAVMSHMYMLADSNYADNHRFYVNATPVVSDISSVTNQADGTTVNEWKTILVGGFGAGGRGYYALDITTPGTPASLWEFSDSDMGQSFGNPVVTQIQLADESTQWVVAFTSGLNNGGNGYLYILNAHTGALLYKIPTLVNGSAVGTAAAPSGLNKLNAWIDSPTYNLSTRFYAGDMLGNLWRFDADNLTAPVNGAADTRAVRLANLSVGGTPQPITTRPELAEVIYAGYKHAVVLVGTGRYLGLSDLSTTGTQSIYGIKDPLTSTGWGNVRPSLIQQTLSAYQESPSLRTLTKNTVDWNTATVAGWYIDLPDSGERVAFNMSLAYNTLTAASLIPVADVCSGDGTSWLYRLDIASGSYSDKSTVAGEKSAQAIVGTTLVQITDNDGKTDGTIIVTSDGNASVKKNDSPPAGVAGLRRTSWRELLPPGQ